MLPLFSTSLKADQPFASWSRTSAVVAPQATIGEPRPGVPGPLENAHETSTVTRGKPGAIFFLKKGFRAPTAALP